MFTAEDIITTDKYRNAFPDLYYKTDVVKYNVPMEFRGSLQYPPIKNTDIIITGHSDWGITDNIVDHYNPRIWFTVNKQTYRNNVHSIPLGITNDCNDSIFHNIYGNIDSMLYVMNEPKVNKNLVYMNFQIGTYPYERQAVFDMFKNNKWVTIGTIENSIVGRTHFLREIRNHTFVLCPRGNGIDTHRLWETLYMGSIPIMKRDIAHSGWLDLPICWIDDWIQVSPEFLECENRRIREGNWNMDKLKMSYWINIISLNISAR